MDVPSVTNILEIHASLVERIRPLGRVIVAFSAGVDSTLVLRVAMDALGRENVLAATGVSPSLAARELQSVRDLAAVLEARLELVNTAEMDSPQYTANSTTRCYFCKSELYGKLTELAKREGYNAVLNGVNADDVADHVNGLRAAREAGVISPLLECGMGKAQVRELARHLGLPNWRKPALACLSSRIPYGMPVTIQSLSMVEKAEAFLWDRGFSDFRVRHHTKLARIEVKPSDLPRLMEEPLRSELIRYFKNIGYTYVTVDLQGFRSGSGNEAVPQAAGQSV